MNLKYFFGSLLSIPLLPLMYIQGKQIRASVPKLPEAQGTEGLASIGSNETKQVAFIGESTFAGVGVSTHEEGFCGTFAKALARQIQYNVSWKVYAKSGYTAKRVRDKLVPKINATNLDLIIVGLGGNDAFTLNSPKKWTKHISELIRDLQEKFPNTPIFFTNMPPIKEFPAFSKTIKFVVGNLVEILGEALNLVCAQNDMVFYNPERIQIQTWSKRYAIGKNVKDFFSDGVHPSKLTYQTWAKDYAQYVTSTLKKNSIV